MLMLHYQRANISIYDHIKSRYDNYNNNIAMHDNEINKNSNEMYMSDNIKDSKPGFVTNNAIDNCNVTGTSDLNK